MLEVDLSPERKKLPLQVAPNGLTVEKLIDATRSEGESIRRKLLEFGVILFPRTEITDRFDFEKFVCAFSGKQLRSYAGGASPRTPLELSRVYTSTEYPPELTLSLHNELSYSLTFPQHVFFCCIVPPASGGETTVGDSRRILSRMDQDIVELFKTKGVRYVRRLESGRGSGYSWQDAFDTDDREVVVNMCKSGGSDFEWTSDGAIEISEVRPATITHSTTKEEVWFNQAEGFNSGWPRLSASFGDGSPICPVELEKVKFALDVETQSHTWSAGDIIVIDNILAAHGRMPFEGKRKIIVAMT